MRHNSCGTLFVVFGLLAASWRPVTGEVFTAMVEVEDLLESEKRVVATLEAYLVAEEERLEKVRR